MDEKSLLNLADQEIWGAVLSSKLPGLLTENLVAIDLSGNQINDQSAEVLATYISSPKCTAKSLAICYCRITVNGFNILFPAIAKSPCLEEIHADNNIISQESCKAFADAFSTSSKLQLISLCGCDISAEGVSAIASAIPQLPSLRHLRLDSNSMYEIGLRSIVSILPQSNIETLSIADNQIWSEAVTEFLQAEAVRQRLEMLDISYNAVDLNHLGLFLAKAPQLRAICLSGCKAKRDFLQSFLAALPRSNLSCLIIDGLNFVELPVTWPGVKDTLWTDSSAFSALTSAVSETKTLTDLRIGFVDPDQLIEFSQSFPSNRQFALSMHDFGRTRNCWVAQFPNFSIKSPSDVFSWKSKVTTKSAPYIGELIKRSFHADQRIDKVELSGCQMDDEGLSMALRSMESTDFSLIDLSSNTFGPLSKTAMERVLLQSPKLDLIISKCVLDNDGLTSFFDFFIQNPRNVPKTLSIEIKMGAAVIDVQHGFAEKVCDLLSADPEMVELKLSDSISATDMIKILSALSVNTHLKSLEFQSNCIDSYKSPDFDTAPKDENEMLEVANALYRALKEKRTKCTLSNFVCPLLTEVFIYSNKINELWSQISSKLEDNRKGKKK